MKGSEGSKWERMEGVKHDGKGADDHMVQKWGSGRGTGVENILLSC